MHISPLSLREEIGYLVGAGAHTCQKCSETDFTLYRVQNLLISQL